MNHMMNNDHIAIYGKGGVGKSTLATAVAASYASRGIRTLLLGCSPKTDSTYFLLNKMCEPTLLMEIQKKGSSLSVVEGCIQEGFNNVLCAETGGPEPASGCAGRGVFHSLNAIHSSGVIEKKGISRIIYDVIADVVCGGFSLPMQPKFASTIFIVTTAEFMSLYAANNICLATKNYNDVNQVKIRVGGLILFSKGISEEEKITADFAQKINVKVLSEIPRSDLVKKAERKKGTVLQYFPDTEITNQFRLLSKEMEECEGTIPYPFTTSECIRYISTLSNQMVDVEKVKEIQIDELSHHKPKKHLILNGLDKSATKIHRHVSVYGKAGIGKSTISSNISAALSEMSEVVLQVGCDPKRDSVWNLTHTLIPTIMEKIRENETSGKGKPELDEIIFRGYNDIYCAEAGGPPPGRGCAGQGVLYALEYLRDMQVEDKYGISFTLYDVLGDVVCGGFAQPIRQGYCKEIYIITNGELLSLIVSNNILKAVHKLNKEGVEVGVGGLIVNSHSGENENLLLERFSEKVGIPIMAYVPRSPLVQVAESSNKTVVEAFSNSEQAVIYRNLAIKIANTRDLHYPSPYESSLDLYKLNNSIYG